MTCIKCTNENLSDYPACLTCAKTIHFTDRWNCLCVECEELPEITIQKVERGTYDFTVPSGTVFGDERLISWRDDFKKRIGKRWRFWNEFKKCWQITPADDQMIFEVAKIIRAYYPTYRVTINHVAAPAPVAAAA